MNGLYILCLFITAVTASHLLTKRDVDLEHIFGPNCADSVNSECGRVFEPVIQAMMDPNLSGLVNEETGRLNLDCSPSAMTEARRCQSLMSTCRGREGIGQMLISWNHHCQNKEATVRLGECWRNADLYAAVSTCFSQMSLESKALDCLENEVSAVPGCGAEAGRLLRELVEKMHEDSMHS